MSETNRLDDQGNDHKYFTLIQHYVWARCLDVYDLSLWHTVKMIAGEKGECFLSSPELAEMAMMSVGKLAQCRARLIENGLLEGSVYKEPGYFLPVWHLRIPDLWEKNIDWRKLHDSIADRLAYKAKQRELVKEAKKAALNNATIVHQVNHSPGEKPPSPGEKPPSPGETKKNHKEEPKEERGGPFSEKSLASTWKSALQELELQMTRGTFTRWLAGSELVSLTDGEATIQVRDGYAVDWCASRLRVPIERTLNDVAGNGEVVVKFVTEEV